jgi:hypothetical protein
VYFFGIFLVLAAAAAVGWYLQAHYLVLDYIAQTVKTFKAGM